MVEGLSEAQARHVGALIAKSSLAHIVDVAVAEGAMRRNDAVVTSNRAHIQRVGDAVSRQIIIQDV